MKIGISADIHLTSKEDHIERYNAFVDILDQCLDMGVEKIIIAGDLFDQSLQNYSEFESLCNKKKYDRLSIHVIPGNHDPDISNEKIVCKNITIHADPEWVDLSDDWAGLFIPYMKERSMGEVIQEMIDDTTHDKWMLIGHGDWSQGMRQVNMYEPGVYMPLTQKDIVNFQPDMVFLGHIHVMQNIGKLFYPGSPCGLDITETHYRHFLIFDTVTTQVTPYRVNTEIVYFNETLLALPLDDEAEYLKKQIQDCISRWHLEVNDDGKVNVRVKAKGFSTNREKLSEIIKQGFSAYNLYDEPDFSEVSNANDPDRDYLMTKLLAVLDDFEWAEHPDEPGADEVIFEAMNLIYGEK